MKLSLIAIVSIALMGIGYYIGVKTTSSKTVEVEKVVNVDHIQTVTVTKEIKGKDGETQIVTVVQQDETKKITEDKKTTEVKAIPPPMWGVSALIGRDKDLKTTYGLKVDRRIVGNVFVGGYIIPTGTTPQLGLSIGYEF